MDGYDSTRDASLRTSIAVSSIEAGEWQGLPHGYTYEERSPSHEKPELDDNIDSLIEELESHNGHMEEEQDADDESSSCHHVPLEDLRTNTRTGLTDTEVATRRKKYGLNQMRKEEKQHPVVKFLMFFVGPIQFVMEVSCERCPYEMYGANMELL
jgi:H+-transporting ATPase